LKTRTSFGELCRGFPTEFVRYFEIVRALHFNERPNYAELRRLFRERFIAEGFVYDGQFDWTVRPPVLARPAVVPRKPAMVVPGDARRRTASVIRRFL
jgi:casein kinase 1